MFCIGSRACRWSFFRLWNLRKESTIPIGIAFVKQYNKPAKSHSEIISFTRSKDTASKWNLIKHEKAHLQSSWTATLVIYKWWLNIMSSWIFLCDNWTQSRSYVSYNFLHYAKMIFFQRRREISPKHCCWMSFAKTEENDMNKLNIANE